MRNNEQDYPDDTDDDNIFAAQPQPSGPCKVKCHKCHRVSDFDISNIEFETETGDEERNMGFEASSRLELQQTCPKCSIEHTVVFEYDEYPLGSISQPAGYPSGVTSSTENCDILTDPFFKAKSASEFDIGDLLD